MIGDTTFFVDIMRKDSGALEKLNDIVNSDEAFVVAVPTFFELLSGALSSSRPQKEYDKVMEVLRELTILELDTTAAEEAARINASLITAGNRIESEDCMIAGIAKVHSEKVVTRNVDHFRRTGVDVETY